MTKPDDKDLEILEAIFHEVALVEAEEGESTPEDKQWAKEVHAKFAKQVEAMRRNLALADAKPKKPIGPKYLAMARDALIARIEELAFAGRVQIAHRNLSGLSDDDLRRLLESLDPQPD